MPGNEVFTGNVPNKFDHSARGHPVHVHVQRAKKDRNTLDRAFRVDPVLLVCNLKHAPVGWGHNRTTIGVSRWHPTRISEEPEHKRVQYDGDTNDNRHDRHHEPGA